MNTATPTPPALKLKLPASTGPLAKLVNLIARGHWSIKHYGPTLGSLFLGAQEDLVKEHQLQLALAGDSAARLEADTRGFAAKVAAIFADGIVDLRERRWLQRHLPSLLRAHTTHTTKLKRLL